ncbi:MAG TPA: N-acetyltransferase [Flavobacteriales bacterium]|jgi:RimJ/RimL family protein N-acetyltransferase|nr:N-acetyltransferase [Flavobacteriales bacterium]HIL66716.1 N-acetyltransferase [Flavobacteriales bacterium]
MDFIRLNEHITLSEITPKDIDSFVEFLNEKEIYINTLTIPFPYTKENSEWFVSFVKKNKKEHGRIINWAIRNKEEKLIGVVGFDNGIDGHKAEIGYWLAKPYWKKGIMSEAVKKICEIGFNEFGLSRITANVFEQYIGSARVVEKCGFTLEAACLKNYYKKDGKLYAKTI